MWLLKILLGLASAWKWLLNLLSINYIGRLEAKIESLEAGSKRKEEVYSELMKIIEARKELLVEKAERMEKEAKEKERQPAEFRQAIEKQSEQVLEEIASIVKIFFSEFHRLTDLRRESRVKLEQLVEKIEEEKKINMEDLLEAMSYDDEIIAVETDFTIKAINLMGKIRTITDKEKE